MLHSNTSQVPRPAVPHVRLSSHYEDVVSSKPQTSRLEDTAYSLFGLFEVNLPLLHGEDKKAFVKLQEEIICRAHAHSVFAWNS